MSLAPMARDPQGLENLKLLYGLGAGQPLDAPTDIQPLPPGSSEPVVAVIGNEGMDYEQSLQALMAQGADQRFPKTVAYITSLIGRQDWAQAAKQIGNVNAWLPSAAVETGPGTASLPSPVVHGTVPPPVLPPVGVTPAVAAKAASPLMVVGGLLAVGLAGLWIVNAASKPKDEE